MEQGTELGMWIITSNDTPLDEMMEMDLGHFALAVSQYFQIFLFDNTKPLLNRKNYLTSTLSY